MASRQVQRLCSSLQGLMISGKSLAPNGSTVARCLSTRPQHPTSPAGPVLVSLQSSEDSTGAAASLKCKLRAPHQQIAAGHHHFLRRSLQLSGLPMSKYICPTTDQSHPIVIVDNLNVGNSSVECPTSSILNSLEMPQIQIPGTEITEPVVNNNQKPAIQAKNIMKIRRRKMNRHQLKKFRRRMKFVLRKQRMAKMKKKEAAFQAVLADIRQKGENYDPLQYIKGELEAARRGGFWVDIRDSVKKPSA